MQRTTHTWDRQIFVPSLALKAQLASATKDHMHHALKRPGGLHIIEIWILHHQFWITVFPVPGQAAAAFVDVEVLPYLGCNLVVVGEVVSWRGRHLPEFGEEPIVGIHVPGSAEEVRGHEDVLLAESAEAGGPTLSADEAQPRLYQRRRGVERRRVWPCWNACTHGSPLSLPERCAGLVPGIVLDLLEANIVIHSWPWRRAGLWPRLLQCQRPSGPPFGQPAEKLGHQHAEDQRGQPSVSTEASTSERRQARRPGHQPKERRIRND
mmetsp:Transcript_53481/g.124578  ORF Transcript_53481/g.124578 Transcript_53481/m.124578 type:complete len:266 (+) Transcript_53481:1029-1826(+)